ncbi:MAG: hypothetical protein M3069_04440 [Chloroflexota bacterium]|nr:hypothetical protein [Chloroflexota bacterium]
MLRPLRELVRRRMLGEPRAGNPAARSLAHDVLSRADYDFGTLFDSSGALIAQPDRHGVRVLVLPTSALPEPALEAILAWRLGQYLLTGFYDVDGVRTAGMRGEPRDLVGPNDLHALAIDHAGAVDDDQHPAGRALVVPYVIRVLLERPVRHRVRVDLHDLLRPLPLAILYR